MIIEKPSLSDLKICVEMYHNLNDYSFVNADKNELLRNLTQFFYKKEFIRIIKKENKIIAWIFAIKTKQLHAKEYQLQQLYYACSESGFLAYRCVVLLHIALIEEAKRIGLSLVASQGSHLDEKNVFTKILERNGWDRRGHTALYRLPRQDGRSGHGATFLSR